MDYPFAELVALVGVYSMQRAFEEGAKIARAQPEKEQERQLTNPQARVNSEDKPARPSRRRRRQATPEEAEFTRLPPQLQRQLLRYGANWTDAMFE